MGKTMGPTGQYVKFFSFAQVGSVDMLELLLRSHTNGPSKQSSHHQGLCLLILQFIMLFL